MQTRKMLYCDLQFQRLSSSYAISEPFYAISVIMCGIFRGYGDTKFPFYMSLVGTIIIRLLLGYLFGYVLAIGLIGIWMGIFVDIIYRGIVCNIYFKKKYSYYKEVHSL